MFNCNPKSIENVQNAALRITWEDGHVSTLPFRELRLNCPCALCRDEWTGRRLIDPATVPEVLRSTRAEVVGNYALSFAFSDGHGTGIYSFEILRKLCRCRECAPHPGSETN
jgi:DUF971 family protein